MTTIIYPPHFIPSRQFLPFNGIRFIVSLSKPLPLPRRHCEGTQSVVAEGFRLECGISCHENTVEQFKLQSRPKYAEVRLQCRPKHAEADSNQVAERAHDLIFLPRNPWFIYLIPFAAVICPVFGKSCARKAPSGVLIPFATGPTPLYCQKSAHLRIDALTYHPFSSPKSFCVLSTLLGVYCLISNSAIIVCTSWLAQT